MPRVAGYRYCYAAAECAQRGVAATIFTLIFDASDILFDAAITR